MYRTKRLFIAIDLPHEVLACIEAFQKRLQREDLFIGTYPALEAIHLTLSFIGDVPESEVVMIEAALDNVKSPVLHAQLGQFGLFMHGKFIKVVYVDVRCRGLDALAQSVAHAVERWAKIEDREFVSHITLARVKHIDDREALVGFVANFEVEPVSFEIQSFALKESFLSSEGAVHRDVVRYELLNLDKHILPK